MKTTSTQRGQSLIEYLVVGLLLTALVAVPIDGHTSAAQWLLDAVAIAWNRFLAALSLPI